MKVEDLIFGEKVHASCGLYFQDVMYNGEIVAAYGIMDTGPLNPLKEWFQKCYPDTPENRELGDGWYEHWDEDDMICVMFDTPEKLVEVLSEVRQS